MQKLRTIEEWMRDKERGDTYERRLVRAGIPEKFHAMTWRDYADDAVVQNAHKQPEPLKDVLEFYVEEWEKGRRTSCVLLGPPGYGKTCGMALLACSLVEQGHFVRWTSFADLTRRKKNLFGMARVAEENDDWGEHEKEELRLRWIEQDSDALFLDDVGKEYRAASGWSDAELDQLLRSRTAAGRATFITSNLKFSDWATYNVSMASFLHEVGEVLPVIEGVDHRRDSGKDSPVSRRARR